MRSAAPILGGPRLGGALARFALPLRPRGQSPTRLTPLHHWGMHIAAPTLTLASKFSLGLRRTDLAGFLPTAPLAGFPLWWAMGGVSAVKTLGQLFRPRFHTDVLLILDGGLHSLDIDTDRWGSSSLSYGGTPHLGGGSNSSDINTDHWGSSSSDSTSSNLVSVHSCILDALSVFPTHSWAPAAPAALPPPPAAIPACPTPLPVNRFTLPPIKTTDDYLAARDLVMY
jgi:hypothetical protein